MKGKTSDLSEINKEAFLKHLKSGVHDILMGYLNDKNDERAVESINTRLWEYFKNKYQRDHSYIKFDVSQDPIDNHMIVIEPGNMYTFICLMDLETPPLPWLVENEDMWAGEHQYFKENGKYYINKNK